LVVCTTTIEIGRVGKFADANVPLHEPERFATGPDGVAITGAVDEEPHDTLTHASTIVHRANVRPLTSFRTVERLTSHFDF
jgi:hypothetical protein